MKLIKPLIGLAVGCALAGILIYTFLPAASPTLAADQACYKEVFKKTVGAATWLVKECQGNDDTVRFHVTLQDGKTAPSVASFSVPDASGLVQFDYSLLSPSTLLLNLEAERGGKAFLVHPLTDRSALSALRFDYMTTDDGHLKVQQNGKAIDVRSEFGDFFFSIEQSGAIRLLRSTKKDPFAVSSSECVLDENLAGDASASYTLHLDRVAGNIVGLKFDSDFSTGEVGRAYVCNVERDSSNATISKSGKVTTIAFEEEGQQSLIKIDEQADGFSASFENVSRANCGAGAQIPRRMVLGAGKKCVVMLEH
ncbi:hypothetical protein AAKU55_003274 [Oxalobacteraceae bacterium GrIS 1.11]